MDPIWQPWHWISFSVFVFVMLVLDLTVFHRHSRESTFRESAGWTVFWCSLAVGFNFLIWHWARQAVDERQARQLALEFLSGYLLEWSLSMDNVFIFAIVFTSFGVPMKYQHRVLFWGILGAVVMRLGFIVVGVEVVKHFELAIALMGAFLIYTAYKLITHDSEPEPEKNLALRLGRRYLRISKEPHGHDFFVREGGKLCATPLFLVLLVIESTDLVFAIDSVPAILGITRDNFVAFTSNVFAILGLRALYFMLAGAMNKFRYLNHGLSAILAFVGCKMILEYANKQFKWTGEDGHLFPVWLSLGVIVCCLAVAVIASLIANAREAKHPPTALEHAPPPEPPAPARAADEQQVSS